MQSHAALDGRLANIENHGASMGDVRDMRVELRDMLTGLDGRLKGLGDGLAELIREASDTITQCNAENFVQLEKNLKLAARRSKKRSRK